MYLILADLASYDFAFAKDSSFSDLFLQGNAIAVIIVQNNAFMMITRNRACNTPVGGRYVHSNVIKGYIGSNYIT